MPTLSTDLANLCNEQIDNELHASHLYLSMAAWLEDQDLPGMADWMRAQSEEEREHALMFYEHMGERGSRVRIGAIEGPKAEWESALALFQQAHEHEQSVTQQIYRIYQAAEKEGDYALKVFLDWFVEEQVEEENSTEEIVNILQRVGDDPFDLWKLDRELAKRDQD